MGNFAIIRQFLANDLELLHQKCTVVTLLVTIDTQFPIATLFFPCSALVEH
jgi:hypothetical protein